MDLLQQLDHAQSLVEKKGVEQWELMALAGESLKIAVRGQEVDTFQQSASQGMALRLIQQGRLGFAYRLGGGLEDLENLVDQALASARAGDLDYPAGLAEPAPLPDPGPLYDPALEDEPLEAKKERALALAAAAREADPRVVHVHPAEVNESRVQVYLRNSRGLDLSRRGSSVSAMAMAVAEGNGGREMGWEYQVCRFLSDLDPARVGAEAGRRAAAFIGAQPVEDGRYPVILENQVAAEFLELLAASLTGDNVVKGRSLLARDQGKQVLSPRLNIVDHGLYPRGLATAPFDDEGTPQAENRLVEKGVVQGFVCDRYWARRLGQQSTGNAARPSLKAPPGVGFKNLYIEPGEASPQELAAGLERGLVISEVMGMHTADQVSGEFSLGAAGHLVEGGRITRPVKSIAVAGQIVELMAAVEAVGDDLRFFGSTGSPSLLVSRVSVSGP